LGPLLAATTLLAAGCGSAQARDVVQSPNACSIVRASRIAVDVGVGVKPLPGTGGLAFDCFYLLPPPAKNPSLFVVDLEVMKSTAFSTSLVRTLAERAASTGTVQLVDGTSAAWNPYPTDVGGGGRLTALRDGAVVFLTVSDESHLDPMHSAVAIMRYVVSRLDAATRSTL